MKRGLKDICGIFGWCCPLHMICLCVCVSKPCTYCLQSVFPVWFHVANEDGTNEWQQFSKVAAAVRHLGNPDVKLQHVQAQRCAQPDVAKLPRHGNKTRIHPDGSSTSDGTTSGFPSSDSSLDENEQ
uniref:Uncharacterized protein n=1 Tax=Eutreptiella gymnastica TaxID=73025 RepID=A0A7S1NTW4_9EUGL|mmetsp:Transcript_87977/g.153004  ORF Transcript_87977/g.153004 Transcript_87977/m.153004 type:complete len:127 (+) Transcript_87977:23-403(+)